MRTVTENTAILHTSFEVKDISISRKRKKHNSKQRNSNEFLEKLWEEQDDSIVEDINALFLN